MKQFHTKFLLFILLALCLSSCKNESQHTDHNNSIYYWRTTFELNENEKQFLKNHDVKRMYIRFFDVDKSGAVDVVVPQATIQFFDSIPRGIEAVPTIYITTNAIERMQLREDEYAEKIMRRVKAMCKKYDINFKELQLDCDWTKSTRKHFYRLCEAIKSRLDSTRMLSSTIRLHQLTQTPPPVDKGVLMVYNTGNLMGMTTDNSIFSYKDIEPYLRDDRLSTYPLPLDVAYPTFGWTILFHFSEDRYGFDRIMRRTDFSRYSGLKRIGDNIYEATSTVKLSPETDEYDNIYPNERIRIERPTAQEILLIKNLIDNKLKNKPHNNILYHLDEEQLSHYSDNEITKIYNRN